MIITDATLVTWESPNRILEKHGIYIEEGRIQEIGPSQALRGKHPEAEIVDAAGQLVMPGNICAHTHFYSAFARGMAIPGSAPGNFPEILGKLWWRLDQLLDPEAIRISTLVCLIDAIRHGTTTLFDHHASPNALEGSLDIIEEAVALSGLRAVLCYEVTDRGGVEKARSGIAENVRYLKKIASRPPSRLAAMFGLHASLTLSDETLEACRDAAPADACFHIHAAEDEADQKDSLAKSGLRVIPRLEKHGILGPGSLLAHAVWIDEKEIEIIAKSGSWVSHQPRSNMNNGVGVAPVQSLLKSGVRVGLGNDGLSNAMWEEWKAAYFVHKVWQHDPRVMSGDEVVRMAVYNNRALASRFFPDAPIGQVIPGAGADLIFVDYHPYTPLTPDNLPWHILFGFNESMITTTIASGRLLMRDRKLLHLDEKEITSHALEIVPKIWKKYQGWNS